MPGRYTTGPAHPSSLSRQNVGHRLALAQLDDLDPLGPLVQAAAQLLDLEPQVHDAPEDELQLLARPSRRRAAATRTGSSRPAPSRMSGGMSAGPDLRARAPAPPWTRSGSGAAARCRARGPPPAAASPPAVMPRKGRSCGWRELPDEAPDQERDVLPALPQRRQVDVEDVEPVVEVVAELAQRHRVPEGPVGGRDHPDVHLDRLDAAHPEEGRGSPAPAAA